MMDKAGMPSGWIYATISDVVASDGIFTDGDWVETKDQDPDGGVRLVQLADIKDGSFLDKSSRFLTRAKAYELNCTFLTKGDLLVARMPDPLGRCCIFPLGGVKKYITVVDVCAVRLGTSPIDPKYMMYLSNSPRVRADIEALKSGSTRKRISRRNLASVEMPLAPQNEQHHIVAKIEQLFSELDKGIESLKTARAQLATYRQAVLKHAFEGKLTAQWRSENKDKLETPEQLLARIKQEREARYELQLQEWKTAVKMWEESGKAGKKPPRPKKPLEIADVPHDVIAKLPQLPESWVWRKLGSLTCGVKYGTAAKSAKAGTAPVLRMGNIQNAKFDWADLVYTSDDDEISEYLLHDGDVLFNRTNSPELVGKTAIYRGERRAIFAGYLIRVNHIRSIADSQYVNLFLNSHVARKYGNSVKTDGVNQSNINGTKLSNYPFPCCSIEEQREVASILEKTLSLVDETEAGISQELQKADALRQSVLKKAFAGQLVAQDLSDEPASVLLDRIKAVKDQARKNGETTEKTRTMRTVV